MNDGQILGRAELRDQPLGWPVTDTRVLARGRIGTFMVDDITTPDGSTISREYIEHPGAVGVIALDDQGRVALVRQYRHPVRHRLLEPPAGLLDVAGESYLLAAQRELAEEVGLAAATWQVLVDLFTTPGMVSESLRIFLARGLSPAGSPDGFSKEGEEADMDCVWASLDDLVDVVLAGEGHNPTLVGGVLAAYAARTRDDFASLRPGDAPWPAREAMLASFRACGG